MQPAAGRLDGLGNAGHGWKLMKVYLRDLGDLGYLLEAVR